MTNRVQNTFRNANGFTLNIFLTVTLQSIMISKSTETLIDSVGATLLSRMVVDQETYRIKTNSLDMLLNRLSPNSLETNGDLTKDDVVFKLPFKAITDAKAKHAQFVDSVVSLLYLLRTSI